MWSLTVLHRHALYGDYRVTEGCWVECESQVPVCGVDRLCEECGDFDGPLTTLVAKDQYLMPVKSEVRCIHSSASRKNSLCQKKPNSKAPWLRQVNQVHSILTLL